MKEDGWNDNTDFWTSVLAAVLRAKAEIKNDTGLRSPNPWLIPRWLYNLLAPGEPDPDDPEIIIVDVGQND